MPPAVAEIAQETVANASRANVYTTQGAGKRLMLPPAASAGVGAAPAAIPLPASQTTNPSALDWINTAIRHAAPSALAARAHGKHTVLRPSARSSRARTPNVPSAPALATALAPAAAGAAPAGMPLHASQTTNPSALDWINTSIRHADPATLARNRAPPRLPTTTPASASASTAASRPAAVTATVITPRNVDDLQRLLATRQRVQPTAPAMARGEPFRRDLPGEEISPGLWLQQVHVPMPVPTSALPLDFARRPELRVDPRKLLFFDTETTGLAGGTGTRAFMIGAADWRHDPVHGPGLRVRQLLMATLGAETAMLSTFAGWLDADTVLSSFNGRSYDAPLLKTRYRLARLPEPLTACDHIDLLHPARRRWKGRWENCRLGTIERHALGIEREDDLPGSQAPGAWLGYLRGGSSALLHRVAAHNHQDVVTLALLLQHLAQPASSLPAAQHE